MRKVNNNVLVEWGVLGTIAGIWFFIGFMIGNQPIPYAQTLDTCRRSHAQISGTLERKCGELQDKTHTEFICNSNDTECWLEIK